MKYEVTMNGNYKIKFLSGVLEGNEIILPLGDFSIGGESGDVVLNCADSEVVALHISESEVTVKNDMKIWVNGKRYKNKKMPLNKVIEVSGLFFCIGNLEDLFHPKLKPIKRRVGKIVAISVALLLCISIIFVNKMYSGDGVTFNVQGWLENNLESEKSITIEWRGINYVSLSGYCNNGDALRGITNQLKSYGIKTDISVHCKDDITSSIKALLMSYGYVEYDVHVNANRYAVIDVPFYGDLTSLAKELDRVPGLQGWKITNSSIADLTDIIQELKLINLISGLSINRVDGYWFLSGIFDAATRDRLLVYIENKNIDANRKLKLRFISAFEKPISDNYFPSKVTGIGGNTRNLYLQLNNGMRLSSGAALNNGYRIFDITTKGISITDDRSLIFIPIHS